MNKYVIRIVSAALMVSMFVTIFSISSSAVPLAATSELPAETKSTTEIKPTLIRLEKSVGIEIEERRIQAEQEAAAKAEAERIAAEQEAARIAAEEEAARKAAEEEAARQAAEKKKQEEEAAAAAAAKKASQSSSKQTTTNQQNNTATAPSYNGSIGEQIVSIARSKIGCPYVSPAQGPNKFDCSGFTSWVYRQVGISLSASSGVQAKNAYATGALSKSELQPGDLVFWSNSYGRGKGNFMGIGHVGIYAGNGMVIDASSDHGRVVERALYDSASGSKFEFGARVY
ncbi:MAG: C40 family peptidase [Massilioclostridium sp.]|nr:C40 family peptidase [Massilioclostridium sp.]MEE1492197.1 C40 family peptidase [Massilioclostridium sp.]